MNPVIFLWAHPRSMSTAIERVMRERGDFDCLHEPFLHYYYLERCDRELPHFDHERGHPSSYAATRDMLLERAERAPVFAKDMSYYVMPGILEDREFCRRLRHCFLIRDPMRAILSYYRLDGGVALDEIGIESQWKQFAGLRDMGIGDCLVLEAEAVQADAERALRAFWDALGLDYRARALRWEQDEVPPDWEYVRGWHESVSASSGIREAPAGDAERTRREFDALCATAPRLSDYLEHHRVYYQRLRQHSLARGADGATA
jgi:hypothetical protein